MAKWTPSSFIGQMFKTLAEPVSQRAGSGHHQYA
jgi:hypothetical protein